MKKLLILGGGMGDPALLTKTAARMIETADVVIGPERLAETLSPLRHDIQVSSIGELENAICSAAGNTIAVLVSGDAGFYSMSKTLQAKLTGKFDIETYNGLSSLQYLSAKLGVTYDDAEIVSLHGRDVPICGVVAYHPKVFALTGGKYRAHDLCAELSGAGLGGVSVTVAENLSASNERITTGTADELASCEFIDLAVMLIMNDHSVCPHKPLSDTDFTRGDVPMTKEEVRWIALSKLHVEPHHTVWDIGAGTGSVAIELARRVTRGRVFAIEREPDALELIHENRKRLGAFNVEVVSGSAPEALRDLPPADRVFIGGTGGNMRDIFELLMAKGDFRVCVTAISLDTLNSALSSMESLGFSGVEVISVNISRSKKVGSHHMMIAQNPIFVLSGEWNVRM